VGQKAAPDLFLIAFRQLRSLFKGLPQGFDHTRHFATAQS
jgi:hypothetical protein